MLLISLLLATLLFSVLSLFFQYRTVVSYVRFKLLLAVDVATLLFALFSLICCFSNAGGNLLYP